MTCVESRGKVKGASEQKGSPARGRGSSFLEALGAPSHDDYNVQ